MPFKIYEKVGLLLYYLLLFEKQYMYATQIQLLSVKALRLGKGILSPFLIRGVEGAVTSWLVRSSPDRAVRVRALSGDIVLCSQARHFAPTVPLPTQVYE